MVLVKHGSSHTQLCLWQCVKSGRFFQPILTRESTVKLESSGMATPVSGKRRRRLMRFKNQPSSVVSESSVPKLLGVVEFAEARAAELESMANAVSGSTGTRRLFQTLPRHMRRRAMSHNSKRLPVRLRQAAEKEFEKQEGTSTSTRASRRHRRRPSNLRSEFSRRQRSVMWLETHMWHAKRMHMGLHWGYRLADAPCEKNVRATYRSMATGCLMSDVSYLGCLQLSGQRDSILSVVSQLTNRQTGPSFPGVQYLHGGYEGVVNLYSRNGYPSSPIGPVSFMWQPHRECKDAGQEPLAKKQCLPVDDRLDSKDSKSNTDRLWLWVHGAMWQEVWDELRQAIQDGDVDVKLASLREELVRFRLCGPAAHSLLQASLQCADISKFNLQDCQDEWWTQSLEWLTQSENASALWQQLRHCAEVPPQAVLGLVVHDPRLNLPQHRENVTCLSESDSCSTVQAIPGERWEEQNVSLLWDDDVRCRVSSAKVSEKVLNQRRGELHLAPDGDPSCLSSSLVPLILSHQVKDRSGFSSGWDVILPQGWAMPFWISFVYHGASVGGLREMTRLALESGSLCFPLDWPDAAAGKQEALKLQTSQEDAYLRHPPSKRTDYSQLCVHSPFQCDWSYLTEQWLPAATDQSAWYVLRDVHILNKLDHLVNRLALSRQGTKKKALSFDDALTALEEQGGCHSQSLVACRLAFIGRGCPEKCASVCLPLPEDWKMEISRVQTELVEKLAGQQSAVDVPCASDSRWIIRCCASAPSRRLMGFVVQGGFSFHRGAGVATAFCSLPALSCWLRLVNSDVDHKTVVLVRNNDSTQYRFAELSIITDIC